MISGTENALFKHGSKSIDFSPVMEQKCPNGFRKVRFEPAKRCRDKWTLDNNYTLVLPERKTSYDVNEYCIDINNKATNKYEHFPEICIDKRIEDSRLM